MNDPKAAASGTAGGITALLGLFSINDVAAIIGIVTAIITCIVFVWSTRKRIKIQEEMKEDQAAHHKKVRKIERERNEAEE